METLSREGGLYRYGVLAGSRLSASPSLVLSARERAPAGDWEGLPPILGQFKDARANSSLVRQSISVRAYGCLRWLAADLH